MMQAGAREVRGSSMSALSLALLCAMYIYYDLQPITIAKAKLAGKHA